jgi:hypothetical protein
LGRRFRPEQNIVRERALRDLAFEPLPALSERPGLGFLHAGGIVALFVHQLDVTGHIPASANQSSRDTSGSGGYVLIRGDTLNLGAGLVTASGGLGGDSTTASTVASSDGYVVVEATTVTGTTNPAAHSRSTIRPPRIDACSPEDVPPLVLGTGNAIP